MSKVIFETNFENGSLLDKVGNVKMTMSNGQLHFIKLNNRYAIVKKKYAEYAALTYYFQPFDLHKPYSWVFNVSSNRYSTWFRLFGTNNELIGNQFPLFNIYYNSHTSARNIIIYIRQSLLDAIELKFTGIDITKGNYILTYDGSSDANGFRLYEQNVENTNKTIITNNLSSITLPNFYRMLSPLFGAAPHNCSIYYKLKQFDGMLSYKERENELIEFLNSKYLSLQKTNFQYPKPTRLEEDGLIAAYNMQPVGNKLVNIAWDNVANGGNASQYDGVTSKVQTNDGFLTLNSNGSHVYSIETATNIITSDVTINFRFKGLIVNANSVYLIRLGNLNIRAFNGGNDMYIICGTESIAVPFFTKDRINCVTIIKNNTVIKYH
ncbi:MAG: hypothetical protein HC892_01450 [Saprospiraceae bacterium]|nr:hypothetical protein [Saprospiraceae bacterium]